MPSSLPSAYSAFFLPQELVDEIVGHLKDDIKSLLSLSSVSSNFRLEAQRWLFRRVAFGLKKNRAAAGYKCFVEGRDEEEQFGWVLQSSSAHNFLSTVNCNQGVGVLIQDLSITIPERDWDTLDPSLDLHQALQQMVNLQRFRIALRLFTSVSMAAVLVDLPCQLTSLSVTDFRRPGKHEHHAYSRFISSQRRLQYLHISSDLGQPNSPVAFHCPTLETYITPTTTPTNFAFSGLPNITTLGLVDSPLTARAPTSFLTSVSCVLPQIRRLTLYSCFFDESDLENVVELLTSLEVLNLVLDDRSTSNRPTRRALSMLHYIHKFPRLQRFIWCALPDKRYPTQLSLLARETQRDLTESWFKSSESLQSAYFAIGPKEDAYWHWYRGWAEPEEVSSLAFRDCTLFNDINQDQCLALLG